jgi:hypothetical protein
MAATEPAKFAQLAAGLIPREALLRVAQRLPGNLESEDWELMLSVCAAIKQALPSANQRQPSEVLNFVLDRNSPSRRQVDRALGKSLQINYRARGRHYLTGPAEMTEEIARAFDGRWFENLARLLSCNVRKWSCWPIEYADLFVVGVTGAKALRRAENVTNTTAHAEYGHQCPGRNFSCFP